MCTLTYPATRTCPVAERAASCNPHAQHFDPNGNRRDAAGELNLDFDDAVRVKHVNYISNSHIMDANNQPREAEYLFAPYSVFTVRAVTRGIGTEPTNVNIELDPAPDNALEPEDLPLAPWY